jgi:hypothetical protein
LEELLYVEQQTKSRNALAAEGEAYSESATQVRAAGSFGNRPPIVLTAGRPYEDEPLLGDAQRNMWIHVLQVEEMRLFTRGNKLSCRIVAT